MRALAASLMVLSAAAVAAPALAASPSPSPSPRGATIAITCPHTPLWTFATGDVPTRAREPDATLGQRFGFVAARTTLDGFTYYETDIPAVEPGLAGTNYWVVSTCASISR
jgi:hypothetical protein